MGKEDSGRSPFADAIRDQFRSHIENIDRWTMAVRKNADAILRRQLIYRIREIIEHPDSAYRSRHERELKRLRRKVWRIDERYERK